MRDAAGAFKRAGGHVGDSLQSLKVSGDLDLEGTAIEILPENLEVGGSLYLNGTKVTMIPATAMIGSKVYGPGCPGRGASLMSIFSNESKSVGICGAVRPLFA